MTQQLRERNVLLEDPDSIPCTHVGSQPFNTIVPGDLISSSALHRHCMLGVHTYRQNIHTDKRKRNKTSNEKAILYR